MGSEDTTRLVLWAVSCLLSLASALTPPVYHGRNLTSHYDAGLFHGRAAAAQITAWLQSDEMKQVLAFTQTGAGAQAFAQLKADNTKAFPQLVDNMRGIAAGANAPLDGIWAVNLIAELENLMPPEPTAQRQSPLQRRRARTGHCSDVFTTLPATAVASQQRQSQQQQQPQQRWHGHNEDWSEEVRPLVYLLVEEAAPDAVSNFSSCAGFAYPGALLGSAFSFGATGIFFSQNAVFPAVSRPRGLAAGLVNRAACDQHTLADMLAVSSTRGQSLGFSLNLASPHDARMLNLETYEDESSVFEVVRNASHFNMYKHIDPTIQQGDTLSSVHRQARADQLPAPQTGNDVLTVLGDTQDPLYPIYTNATLATALFDLASSVLRIWTNTNPALAPPAYTWDLTTFWGTTKLE